MKDFCILSDFDGTISKKDGLYTFISQYARVGWEIIEQDWAEGRIDSKKCLIEEFKLIPALSEELIDNFIKTLEIDEYFAGFYDYISKNNIDFYIVSDGIDYFINGILKKYGLNDIKIFSNHGEFNENNFTITFPNDNPDCVNNAGTCKCAILNNLRKNYKKIYYIGDGVSDYCVADKADALFAKSRLATFCQTKNIKYTKYVSFKDIFEFFMCKGVKG